MNFLSSKKGGIFDIILAMIISFVLVVALVLFMYMGNLVNAKLHEQAPLLQNGTPDNVTEILDQSMGKVTQSYSNFTWIAPLLIFGFFMSVIISSFVVKQHPAWFFGYLMIVVICVILAAYLSNVYQTLMANGTLAGTFYAFTFANYIFIYFPIWIAVFGGIAAVVMYSNIEW